MKQVMSRNRHCFFHFPDGTCHSFEAVCKIAKQRIIEQTGRKYKQLKRTEAYIEHYSFKVPYLRVVYKIKPAGSCSIGVKLERVGDIDYRVV